MGLCGIKELLNSAEKENKAVGAFNVSNMEMIIGTVKASEECNTPIIVQIAESRLNHSPLYLIAPMMIAAAKNANTDIAVHFDHGATKGKIKEALDLGFTSVMYDGSKLPLSENVKNTLEIKELAKSYGAGVEAELGILGKDEDGNVIAGSAFTDPETAKEFAEKTCPDCLAVAIGNAHGFYKGKPELRLDILEEIDKKTDIPLVLHGGTGIYPEDFRRCIDLGIRKINIATANFHAFTKGAKEYFDGDKFDYFSLNEKLVESVFENVRKHIYIFNNRGAL